MLPPVVLEAPYLLSAVLLLILSPRILMLPVVLLEFALVMLSMECLEPSLLALVILRTDLQVML